MRERQESHITQAASWLCLAASFALSFTTWTALGENAGYNITIGSHYIPLALALAISVDTYIITALMTWLHSTDQQVRTFAQRNTYIAAILSIIAQSAYHGTLAHQRPHNPIILTLLAIASGAAPPAFAALAVHMRTLTTNPALAPPSTTTPPATAPAQATHHPITTHTVAPTRATQPSLPPQPSQPPVTTRRNASRPGTIPPPHNREGRHNARNRKVTAEVEARIQALWEQKLPLETVMHRSGYGRSTCLRIKTALNEIERERRGRVA